MTSIANALKSLSSKPDTNEFLLKFSKDRQRLMYWLFEAKKRFRLTILGYMITSNHIHLLVVDDGPHDTISK